MLTRLTTDDFIRRSIAIHGKKYDYSRVVYVNNKTHVELLCDIHGSFLVRPDMHLYSSNGCPECGKISSVSKRSDTCDSFIRKAKSVHGDKYSYSNVVYKNNHIEIDIICKKHGVFKQTPRDHIHKSYGCPTCYKESMFGKTNPCYRGGVAKSCKPLYSTYYHQLCKYEHVIKIIDDDLELLGVECKYCGKIYVPTRSSVIGRLKAIHGKSKGSLNFYCSENCKKACPTFGQRKYPKGFKPSTSREVQPQLRKLVLKRDNYKCQICNKGDVELHCHHITGVKQNPIESADVDNCVTLCKSCHKNVHKLPDCGFNKLKCMEEL